MLKPFLSLVLLCSLLPGLSLAQLQLDTTITPTNLAQLIMPFPNALVSNVTYTGIGGSKGFFTATNSNLGLTAGVVLTTGYATMAKGPNISSSTGVDLGPPSFPSPAPDHDIDLDTIIQSGNPGVYTNDATVLEFDFVSMADTIVFSYVFGSEEYLEFVGSINDVFAIFLSGPGITGKKNIAVVPNSSSTPVGVNTVNDQSNAQYYVNNDNGTTIEYDGFTTPLTATAIVQVGLTYHLKIAIADASDGVWDSGVFIGANASFLNSTVENTAQTQLTLYPNPATDLATLAYNFTSKEKAVVAVFDATGRMVYTTALPSNSGTTQLPTGNLSAGIYHVKVSAGNKKPWVQKLVVVK